MQHVKFVTSEADKDGKEAAINKVVLDGEFTAQDLIAIWRKLSTTRRYVIGEDAATNEIIVGDRERCLFFLRGPKMEREAAQELVDSANMFQGE